MDRAVVGHGPKRHLRIEHTLMAGDGLVLAARCVVEVLRPSVTAVAAVSGPATALAAAVAALGMLDERPLRVMTITEHGAAVGAIDGSDRVAILLTGADDGMVLEAVMSGVQERRTVPVQVVAVVDPTDEAIRRRLADRGINYIGLVSPEELGVEA
jgi:hypothetical protein